MIVGPAHLVFVFFASCLFLVRIIFVGMVHLVFLCFVGFFFLGGGGEFELGCLFDFVDCVCVGMLDLFLWDVVCFS